MSSGKAALRSWIVQGMLFKVFVGEAEKFILVT